MESNYLYEYVKYLLKHNEIKTKDVKTVYHLTNYIENMECEHDVRLPYP